LIDLTLDNFKL